MEDFTQRTRMLLGDGCNVLANSSVAVFGLGGVGSYAAEALARAGIGKMLLCDGDTVSTTNINRQLCALNSTVGMKKTEVVAARLRDINPDIDITVIDRFISANDELSFLADYTYIADCIDDVPAKLAIISSAKEFGVSIISALGCGNRLDPEKLTVTDIYKTSGCPLARSVRSKLRKIGIDSLDVLFSSEEPIKPEGATCPGSISFVPSAAGLIMAGKIIRDISGVNQK
ncbi:MAG: tRNA threonylcarbamoyladenosine dehydratase [Oscillospiraceae bacterium]|nr:tRNA threonylcarbamoyladenosine dehydratase [Oscillospiraceae bacterium]